MVGFFTLGRWYADPCPADAARQALALVEQREQALRRRGRGSLALRLSAMRAQAALGEDVEAEYERLAALVVRRHTRAQALVELVYGQILMSRRRTGAMRHLDRGFALARHLLAPEDYFVVLKRHALLALLPPADLPCAPLADLLTTARVMARLGARRNPPPHDPGDTFG
ncbi:MAG: hypothetical protein M0R77_04465 [Gammaproteobacteria bacterium]|nr:hypothetical protein [Gammaproteobacteria bacterium]